MAVRLRMKRFGRRHHPTYRLTAVDGRKPRDGRVLEEIGIYDPLSKDIEKQVVLKRERIEYWLSVGAQPSNTVRSLLCKNGFDVKPVVRPTKPRKQEEQQEPEQAAEKASSEKPSSEKPSSEETSSEETSSSETSSSEESSGA